MQKHKFLCAKCLEEDFYEETYECEKCNVFITNRKDHFRRHQSNCFQWSCHHCNLLFMNKKSLKIHEKQIEKTQKTKRIMEFMNEKEQQNLELIMGRMDMEHNE